MKIICILGPTACGKKEIAKYLIEKFDKKIEFISCDSRKVYRYFDIGTAKPDKSILPFFHLIDIKNPDENYSAGEFAKDSEKLIKCIKERKKVPIIIGGTPLYYRALFSEFFVEPKKDPTIRQQILEKLRAHGSNYLHNELMKIDPETAEKLHLNDWIRITRALEIYYNLGIPPSQARQRLKKKVPFSPIYFGVMLPRNILYKKIEERTKWMFSAGLVDEVKKILELGYSENLPSLNTIGYKETIKYLRGEYSFEEAQSKTIKNTKVYSRRQMNFFKSFENVKWYDISRNLDQLLKDLEGEINNQLNQDIS